MSRYSMTIKRGDDCFLSIALTSGGRAVLPAELAAVEFTLPGVRKRYPEEVAYHEEERVFKLPLTQRETLCLEEGALPLDIRVKYRSGAVVGTVPPLRLYVAPACSGEVL